MQQNKEIEITQEVKETIAKAVYVLDNITDVKELEHEKLQELLLQAKSGLPALKKLILPAGTDQDINKIYSEAIKNKNDKTNPIKFTEEEQDTLWMLGKALGATNETYIYTKDKQTLSKDMKRTGNNGEELVNTFKSENKEIGIKNLDFTNIIEKHEDKKINEDMALNLFKSMMGSGEIVKIPLYNSGFTVDINSPTLDDIISVQNNISQELTRVGEGTINLIFSNTSIIINKHIINLFLKLINRWTLNVSKEELLDYISIIDLNVITAGILSSMYPRGVEYASNCINATVIEDNKPKCNFKAEGTIDVKKLIWVDHKLIPNSYKYLFNRSTSGSVSVEEVKAYRKVLEDNEYKSKVFDIINVNGLANSNEYKLEFRIPNLTDYINEAQAYITDLETRATLAFSNSEDDKEANLAFLVALTFVSIYSTFINKFEKSLPNGDVANISSRDNILNVLASISSTGEDPSIINNAIIDYINSVSVSVAGTPNYICPLCKEKQTEEDDRLSKINTVALDKIFFGLGTLIILKSSRALS